MNFKTRVLLIDDARWIDQAYKSAGHAPVAKGEGEADYVRITRSYQEGIQALANEGPWDLLLLDHDLASYDEEGHERTGYDVMCFLEENPHYLPKNILCCSSNAPGRMRINQVIEKLYEK